MFLGRFIFIRRIFGARRGRKSEMILFIGGSSIVNCIVYENARICGSFLLAFIFISLEQIRG